MDKRTQLQNLKKRMQEDMTLPLRDGATQLVFGEGDPDSYFYFLGEAPGFWEDQKGRPFVGNAGQLLDSTLESVGFKREEIYISNVVRFRPPNNRDPLPEEISAFAPYIDQEIEIVNPKVIITLGRFSMGKFFRLEKISRIHGKPKAVSWKDRQIVVVPMFHPSAALRSPEVMAQFKKDFTLLPRLQDKIIEKQQERDEAAKKEQLSLI